MDEKGPVTNPTKVAVFIDNSNVFRNLHDLKVSDPLWVLFYNPLALAQKLAGNRELVYVAFYCVRPPAYLLEEGEKGIRRYTTTLQYYAAIEKLSPVLQVKYGDLRGSKGNLQEKNVDTQLATDMVTMAALGKFDTAILISNDGDYVSAVENVKNNFLKKVEVVFLMGRLSMALRQVCDITRRARRSFFEKLRF
jgi:uncharacterized LabA/DUF88 family protein